MKILIVRFSSIGDIVLTTPLLRAIKAQRADLELHYLTKKSYASLLDENPHIDRLYAFDKDIREVIPQLKAERYDLIIDLHKNIRTLRLKFALKRPSSSFSKLNVKKWFLVNFKKDTLPNVHVVDRYYAAISPLNVVPDRLPGEVFISEKNQIDTKAKFGVESKSYITVAIGAQFSTKRMPEQLIAEIIDQMKLPVLLVGGPEDQERAEKICELSAHSSVTNTCGTLNIMQSASVVSQSTTLLTGDTGMMHIAACFNVPIVSVWGNTVPALGMYPYYPNHKEKYSIHQVEGLSCRPCSKIGFQACPKKHFNCMHLQNADAIAEDLIVRSEQAH